MRLDEWGGEFIVGSLLVGYDIGQNVKDEERHVAAETDPPTAPEPAEESEEQSSSVPLWLRVLAVLTVGGVFEVIIYGYLDRPGWIGVSDKKFWDYLELLIVPAALALGVYWLNRAQQERERKADEAQQRRERKAEEDRRERELEVENQRVQDAALQAYLDQMSRLLADKDRPLHKERPGDSLSTIARAHTLTVLPRLNGVRKRSVIQFLYESELIGGSAEGKEPVMLLHGADLRGADLRGITLKGANLPRTNLQRSNLSRAWLDGANLQRAVLSESNLTAAELDSVDLGGAWLEGAKLRRATLRNANLRQAQLIDADLGPTNLTELYDVGRSARLYSEADMKRTVKEGGKSRDTHYGGGADLRGADLRGANLRGANLRGANLSNVTGFTTGELKQEAKTLERATMPDGQKYYGAAVFEPAFHFLVSQDWVYYEAATTPNTLYIEGRQGGQLLFANPRHVFDSSNASEQKEVPRPANADEWVSWFQSHPNLDTSEPVPMSVGGASGVRIDVTPTSENESGVVLLFPVEDTQFGSYVGSKDRLVIVDVEGETVVINVAAPAGKFDEFLPKAQKVLDTVEWNGR